MTQWCVVHSTTVALTDFGTGKFLSNPLPGPARHADSAAGTVRANS